MRIPFSGYSSGDYVKQSATITSLNGRSFVSLVGAGTSLKAFILEANGLNLSNYGDQKYSLNLVHEHARILKRYGLKQMHELSDKVAKDVAKHYFNVMAIRHPFDRLVAYYRDEMVDTDKSSNHPKIAAAILREFRPQLFVNNKTLSKMNYPQQAVGAPTFK
ncbi:hypothetical protein LSH36_1393g00008 [Paralvinella palmiformis]|uniref:Sulfotransferase family protein n=1 Tax=Paralvinella palmiformis TaxID=53620 RepID=A0AAD9MQS5_9ANNE|nr:hypothetical protein LSH36_1393g00008 [Paralvinella palmiformis]